MRNKRTALAIIVLAAVILATDFSLLQANMLAIAWHLRHGFHVEFEGLRFPVPLFYQQGQEGAFDELTIYSYHSPIHRKNAWITIGSQPQLSGVALKPLSMEESHRLGAIFVAEKSVNLPDRQGKCIEYERNQLVLRNYGPSDSDLLWITCRFGYITANFDGTRNAREEFYSILKSARKVHN